MCSAREIFTTSFDDRRMDIETDAFCRNLFTFKPWHPTRMFFIDREQSFENWPLQIAQKPRDLVLNGFFYTGIGDQVTCFYCNVTLKQWEKTEIIEIEHLKYEPNCLYAKMVSRHFSHSDIYST